MDGCCIKSRGFATTCKGLFQFLLLGRIHTDPVHVSILPTLSCEPCLILVFCISKETNVATSRCDHPADSSSVEKIETLCVCLFEQRKKLPQFMKLHTHGINKTEKLSLKRKSNFYIKWQYSCRNSNKQTQVPLR